MQCKEKGKRRDPISPLWVDLLCLLRQLVWLHFINNKKKGTIEGLDFMTAVFTIYLGDKPASEPLKKGLLGK